MQTGTLSNIVGNTPLIKISSLSRISGCEIFAKAEFLNPGGSVKDRTALGLILDAEKRGVLKQGMTLVEGTAGNTGIGLATIAADRGYKCIFVLPDNQSLEKYQTLEALGVDVLKVPAVPFSNENHFYHTAKRLAESRPDCFWTDQFENLANYQIHYQTTGPEIWTQMQGQVDAFVSAAGTGGTIAGVSNFLKERDPKVHVRLVDPAGSGLFSYLKTGTLAATGSSITEGIGIMRITANFKQAKIDDVVQVSDQDMYSMILHLAKFDGLLVGTSAALNVFAAYQWALENKSSSKSVVTILCDSALRYQSKIFNPEFLKEKGLIKKLLINT